MSDLWKCENNKFKTFYSDPCAYFKYDCYYYLTSLIFNERNNSSPNKMPHISDLQWHTGNLMMVECSDLDNYVK